MLRFRCLQDVQQFKIHKYALLRVINSLIYLRYAYMHSVGVWVNQAVLGKVEPRRSGGLPYKTPVQFTSAPLQFSIENLSGFLYRRLLQ